MLILSFDRLHYDENIILRARSCSIMSFEELKLCTSHHLISLPLVLSLLPLSCSMSRVELPCCITFPDRRLVQTFIRSTSFITFAIYRHCVFIVISRSLVLAVVLSSTHKLLLFFLLLFLWLSSLTI